MHFDNVAEFNDFLEALRELQKAVRGLHSQQLETRDAIGKVVTDSHLRSTLTLLREDIGFKRTLELVKHDGSKRW